MTRVPSRPIDRLRSRPVEQTAAVTAPQPDSRDPELRSVTPAPAAVRRTDFASLSGLRAVAAYLVIGTHVGFFSGLSLHDAPAGPFLARMPIGVTIFFLLSGFLLSRRFLADPEELRAPELRQFWWRRAVRVLPAYWLAIIAALTVLSANHTSLVHWASYLLLAHPYSRMPIDSTLSQMWTLSVEVTFYAVLPLLIWLSRRWGRDRRAQSGWLVAGLCLLALAGNLVVHLGVGDGSIALLWMPLYLDWFALGIALAAIRLDRRVPAGWQRLPIAWAQLPGTCWVIAGLLFWLSTLPVAGPRDLSPPTTWEWTIRHVLFAGAAWFVLLPLVLGSASWPERLLGNRAMRWLGEISYGVYLWHLGLLIAIHRWLGYSAFSGHFWVLYLATASSATLVAAASWHLVERPLLRRFSRSWRLAPRQQAPDQDRPDRDQAQQLNAGAVREGVG